MAEVIKPEADSENELDLRRLANARMVRRIVYFVATGAAAALLARSSTEFAHWGRVLASQTGFQVKEDQLVEFGFAVLATGFLLQLGYMLGTLVWQWRTFVPLLESKKPEEVAVALIRLTSIFATSQRLAQSRQLVGAGATFFGLGTLIRHLPPDPDLVEGAVIPLILIGIGVTMMFVSFWLRYGFSYARTVLVPLLEAVVGAEQSKLDEATISKRVAEIVKRVRKEKPWWFIRPTWFL